MTAPTFVGKVGRVRCATCFTRASSQGCTCVDCYRFSGFAPFLSIPLWYNVISHNKTVHYLRLNDVWQQKLAVEKRIFQYAIDSLYWFQQNTVDGPRFGIDNDSFTGVGAPYKLSDFGTSSYEGDVPVACRVYHRVLARCMCRHRFFHFSEVGVKHALSGDAYLYPWYARRHAHHKNGA